MELVLWYVFWVTDGQAYDMVYKLFLTLIFVGICGFSGYYFFTHMI